ncbi:MAG TPA: glycosyltransferase [Stellaceae bacterium]|jgi:chlorobactene glucosyltransferase
MPILLCGLAWAGLVGYLLSRAVRQFRAHHMIPLQPASSVSPAAVSIIVPARNEADNIGACLRGLTQQADLAAGSLIIVVDDGSEDGTTAAVKQQIARGHPIALTAAGPLPVGWVGKPHACWRGAMLARGGWLCFIDADVRAAPQLVAAAIETAEAQRIDMLSLHPFQELGSFWERLVIPAGLLIIACAQSLNRLGNSEPGGVGANGQFILIRREVYFAVGGHAAVGAEICEDRALAASVERAGYRFRVLAAEHLATTRMYRDFNSLWEGLSKNAIEILGSSGLTMAASTAGVFVGWAALLLPAATAAVILPQPSPVEAIGLALTVAGSAIVIGVQLGTARHFRIPALFGILMPCGYSAALVLACHSFLLRRGRGVTWKGRKYDMHRKPSAGRS